MDGLDVLVGAATDAGLVRQANEDSVLWGGIYGGVIQPPDEGRIPAGTAFVGVVADGMGGAAAGKTASLIVVQAVSEVIQTLWGQQSLAEILRQTLTVANARVSTQAGGRADLQGMGATVECVCVAEGKLRVLRVGDSRTYVLGARGLGRVGSDMTLAQHLVETGKTTADAAASDPRRSQLVAYAGMGEPFDEVLARRGLHEVALEDVSAFLVCSDGLTNEVSEQEIERLLAKDHHPREIAQRLVDMARGAGGRDNITVIVGRVVPKGHRPPPMDAPPVEPTPSGLFGRFQRLSLGARLAALLCAAALVAIPAVWLALEGARANEQETTDALAAATKARQEADELRAQRDELASKHGIDVPSGASLAIGDRFRDERKLVDARKAYEEAGRGFGEGLERVKAEVLKRKGSAEEAQQRALSARKAAEGTGEGLAKAVADAESAAAQALTASKEEREALKTKVDICKGLRVQWERHLETRKADLDQKAEAAEASLAAERYTDALQEFDALVGGWSAVVEWAAGLDAWKSKYDELAKRLAGLTSDFYKAPREALAALPAKLETGTLKEHADALAKIEADLGEIDRLLKERAGAEEARAAAAKFEGLFEVKGRFEEGDRGRAAGDRAVVEGRWAEAAAAYAKANETYAGIARAFADALEARVREGREALEKEDYKEAEAAADGVLEHDPAHEGAKKLKADASRQSARSESLEEVRRLEKDKKWADAAEACAKLLEADDSPETRDKLLKLASREDLDRKRDAGRILAVVKRLLDRQPDEALGKVHERLVRFVSREKLSAKPGTSLASLLADAYFGETIDLADGDYEEAVRVTKPVRLVGHGNARILVKDGAKAALTIDVPAGEVSVEEIICAHGRTDGERGKPRPDGESCVIVEAGTVRLAGLQVVDSSGHGIDVRGRSDVTITSSLRGKKSTVSNSRKDGVAVGEQAVITLREVTVAKNENGFSVRAGATGSLEECSASDNRADGILLEAAVSISERCRFVDNGGNGVHVKGVAPKELKGTLCDGNAMHGILLEGEGEGAVQGNTCMNNKASGIRISGRSAWTVVDNGCSGNKDGIHFEKRAGGKAQKNRCFQSEGDGIVVEGAEANPALNGNECSGNDGRGILVSDGARPSVTDNVCKRNGQHGIEVRGKATALPKLEGNRCAGNKGKWITFEEGAPPVEGYSTKNFDKDEGD